ncbi:S1 RNA-binding domain-containing protein [Romboutsia ilealis]|uniref:S1 RNA-binding domain-containing protein n=1 Tax=Romboutsia faecis TaxID=2764597 RepID=A0ABR7JR27_9FIRM|nr:S1 RNA-binding domain-containing protein [Romboutsia faecis]MBC5997354.1 S1 RNA-binding domain-containing protein [Romboutsia faecis]MRN23636.1 S1 RNA-binding domain-containing protein [Romboutsia ilealis]
MTNELSMKDLLEQQEQAFSEVKVGKTITAKIIKVTHDEVVLDLEYGFDGIVPAEELNIEGNMNIEEVYNVEDEITAVIQRVNEKDGTIRLSKLQADRKNDLAQVTKAHEEHRIITVKVEKAIERGVFVKYRSIELFMPISQIDTKFVKDTKEYVGANLEVYVIELDAKKNRFVVSHREVLQERINKEREERRARIQAEKEAERARVKAERDAEKARIKQEKEDLFNSLEAGQKRHGKVTKIMSYGAFVDLGGLEGLVHINNLSWKRVESVEDMLQEGQEVDVYVLDVDAETRRIALALKDINNDPWQLISEDVYVDDLITGKVVRIIDRGAFLEIREGVEAFLPISELSEDRVVKVTNVVNIDDEVKVKVLNFNPENRRMLVSKKEAEKEPEEDYTEYLEVEESLGTLGDLFKDKFKGLDK